MLRCRCLFVLIAALLAGACSETQTPAPSGTPTPPGTTGAAALPEPPAPLTSATHIYSGGWLVRGDGSEPLFDGLVVVREGRIVALGKRGEVDVPADSVGIDASGKWLLPGSLESLRRAFAQRDHEAPLQFGGDALPALTPGSNADFVLLNRDPLRDPEALTDVHGIVSGGELSLIGE